jgi:hypothetical protein
MTQNTGSAGSRRASPEPLGEVRGRVTLGAVQRADTAYEQSDTEADHRVERRVERDEDDERGAGHHWRPAVEAGQERPHGEHHERDQDQLRDGGPTTSARPGRIRCGGRSALS